MTMSWGGPIGVRGCWLIEREGGGGVGGAGQRGVDGRGERRGEMS